MSSNSSSVSTRRVCFHSLFIKNPVVLSLFTKTVNFLSAGDSFITKFTSNFSPTRISDGCHTEIHVALKYTAPWHTIVLTNWNWEQMANGADNCCLLLKNHKQTLTHEPHCSPWNILPSSGPQVNYFPSFQMLSDIRHVCTSQQGAHRSPSA
jgi:hypothetical protein